jgi:DNA-binding CsgD family transcriptional regulator
MWHHPDSALAVMLKFAGSDEVDSLNEFEGHYCQVLVAELLFKNDYGQSNRKEVLKAVHYFDSIVGMDGADARGKADTRGVSLPFLDARAHYMNGVGFYEQGNLINSCTEYLTTLEVMESRFATNELVGTKARFMALTYNRLGDLFSEQYMQEPAIYCFKQALVYNRIAPTSPYGKSNILYRIGKQYDKLQIIDSAAYYYHMALELMPDRNNMIYRDIVSSRALFEFLFHNDTIAALNSLKSMAAQAVDEAERINRKMSIGSIYYTIGQYDSAKICLEPVVENDAIRGIFAANFLREIALSEGDTLKANEYAFVLAKEGALAPSNQAQVSRLNDLFQNYLQKKQEKAEVERRLAEQEAARLRWRRGLAVTVVVMMALGLGLWCWLARRKKEHEAETQTWHEEKQQLQTQVDDALQQLQTQADDALQQARAMLPQRANEIYSSKVGNRLERIMDEFETAYPNALERVAAAHPDLTPTERRIFVLSHLQFRAKEMADLLGLSENTVNQYRYNLRKKTENASFSAFLD